MNHLNKKNNLSQSEMDLNNSLLKVTNDAI